MAAPTFHGVTSAPADNGAQAGPTVTVDKDAGALSTAQAGDLIVVVVQYRAVADVGSNAQVLPNESGGQNWNVERGATGSSHHSRVIWCRFNGTWTADPTFSNINTGTPTGTLALTAVALVFRPTSSSKHWVVCNGPFRGTFTAGTTPFTKTITGITPRKGQNVTIGVFSTGDDNTWDTLSGTNWTQSGLSAQYRNTTGTDQSMAIVYQLQDSAAATNDVSLNQATLGGDAGLTQLITFAEVDMPVGTNVATVAFVKSADNFDAVGGTGLTATFGSAVGSGNAVVGSWNFETTAGGEVTSITDSQSNEYFQLLRLNDMIFEQTKLWFWRPGITNAPTTVTGTLSAAEVFRRIMVHEVAGIGTFDLAVGAVVVSPDTSSTWNPTTPSRTPSANGCYIFGSAQVTNGADAHDVLHDADGWTLRVQGINAVPDEPNDTHDQVQGTATAEDYDLDVPAAVSAAIVNMGWAAFKAAVAADDHVILMQPMAPPGWQRLR